MKGLAKVLLLSKGKVHFLLLSEGALGNPDFLNWLDWNVYGTPIIWGIGLTFHAISVFVTTYECNHNRRRKTSC